MKSFLVLVATLGVVSASGVQFSPALYTAAIPITTQYHAQDGLGQYSYGYSGGPSAKAEYKSLDGVTRGSYSYVDADGELQTVEYTADSANGFQASATNLPRAPIDDKSPPKPVEDTPEVAMAKAEHFAAVREAEQRAAEHPGNSDGNGNEGQDEQSSNGFQEQRSDEASREATSAETESPNGLDNSSERESEQSSNGNGNGNGDGNSNGNGNENGNGNGNGNRNGNRNGNGNGIENGGNGITRLSSNGLNGLGSGLINGFSGLSNGLSSSLSSSLSALSNSYNNGLSSSLGAGLSLGSLNGNGPLLSSSSLSDLSKLQLNGDFTSSISNNNGVMQFSEITPATTSQLRPISLTSVRVPATSYLRVSTPTHGYSIISPTVLTAVPTLRATSSQTISRTLPISLGSTFLTKGFH